MTGKFLRHLRRKWMGALALFIVLASGSAYAANTVFSSDIVDGQRDPVKLAVPVASTATWGAAASDVLTRSWTALSVPSAA